MFSNLKTAVKTLTTAAAIISLAACSAQETSPSTSEQSLTQYPLRKHFECLPDSAALIAAHRGTSKRRALTENSAASLEALIEKEVMIAEIDIARTKDGVHFLFHDGVWDKKTVGKGIVASTHWNQASTYLLRDTEGKVSAHNLIRLEDYLSLAAGNIYLEIDFKSSARYKTVIGLLRDYNMADKSVLIAYNEGQARKLAKLAPDMIVSVPISNKADIKAYEELGVKTRNMAAWTGKKGPSRAAEKTLKDSGAAIIAYPAQGQEKSLARRANIIITDYALDKKPIIGRYNKADYKACLSN